MNLLKNLSLSQRGSVLVQALAATVALGALVSFIAGTVRNMGAANKNMESIIDRDRAAYDIAQILKDPGACVFTFGGSGVTIVNGGNLSSGHTAGIRDASNIVRYEPCSVDVTDSVAVNDCNPITNTDAANRARVSSGRLRLMRLLLMEFNSTTNVARLRMDFLNGRDELKYVTRDINVYTDGANEITQCYFGSLNPVNDSCVALGGTIEGTPPNEFCKSIHLSATAGATGNAARSMDITGNLQVGGNLNVQGGIVLGTNPTARASNPAGRLDVIGDTLLTGSLNVGTIGAGTYEDPSQNRVGRGQIEHSMWIGSTARGSVNSNELRTDNNAGIYVNGQLLIPGISNTETFTTAQAQITAITEGWVKTKMAEVVTGSTSGATFNNVWNEIFTAATAGQTNAEEDLRQDFCQTVRVVDYNGSFLSMGSNCRLAQNHMPNRCNSNGNCTNVYADNQICINGTCRSSWPSLSVSGACVAANVYTYTEPGNNFTTYHCPGNQYVYVGGALPCCPYGL